jgi:PE family
MSFVLTEPELMQGAVQDLAGIRSSLAEVATTVSGPTTGIAAAAQDEVSTAIASLFGGFGQQFHVLNAQAQAFHAEFESLLSSGAAAYVRAEAANAQQVLTNAVGGGTPTLLSGQIRTGAQAISQSPMMQGLGSFGAAVAAPYQALVSNTINNLQAIGTTISTNPLPFLHQFANNQIAYGQTIATGLESVAQNIPAALANIPANIQIAIQGASTFNPGVLLQQFVNQQIGYAQTISTGLQGAARDLVAGLQTLPSTFQATFQALAAGNVSGALTALNQGLTNAFLPGFTITQNPVTLDLIITPEGPLGDLAPIFAIPGQMAQNFTNLIPPGTIPAQIAQNATNLVAAFTNFGTSIGLLQGTFNFGIPLQLIFDGIGGPVNALSALNSSAVAFGGALQIGNMAGAAAALLDAPANMANGFLNGTTLIELPPASLLGLDSFVELPLGGILTPVTIPSVFLVSGDTKIPLIFSGGTGIGGIIPGLLSFPAQLAEAIAPITPAM